MSHRSLAPFTRAVLVLCIGAALTGLASAAEWQPVATATSPSADALVAALKVIGRSSGNPNLDATIRGMIAGRGVKGELPGLDRERRGAVVVETDGLAVVPMALVPVKDGEALLQSLAPLIGPANKTDAGNFRVGQGEATGYVKLSGGWAYVAQSESDFRRLPDPMVAAGGPPEEDFAVQLWPKRLPEAYRTMAIDYLDGKGAPGASSDGSMAAGLLRGFLAEAEHVRLVSRMEREKPIQHMEIELKPAANTRSYQRMISLSATGFRGAPLEGQVRLGAALALISLDWPDARYSSYLGAAGSFLAADDDAIKYQLKASDGKYRLKLEMAEGIMRSAGTGLTLLAVTIGQ